MIINKYSISGNNLHFDLAFKDNLVLVDGESGVGKTLLYKMIDADARINKKSIICLSRLDMKNDNDYIIKRTLETCNNMLIVIDNAEIILDKQSRVKVSLDKNNQYLIFSHTTSGFIPNELSLATLEVKNNIGKLVYDLE